MPSVKSIWGKASSWIFLIGIIVAVIVGLAIGAEAMDPLNSGEDTPAFIAAFLGVLGFIAGILAVLGMGTITKTELPIFMIATVIIVAIGANTLFADIKWFGPYLAGITSALSLFIAPLAGLIALKAIWDVGKD
jgi:hypothetical protein